MCAICLHWKMVWQLGHWLVMVHTLARLRKLWAALMCSCIFCLSGNHARQLSTPHSNPPSFPIVISRSSVPAWSTSKPGGAILTDRAAALSSAKSMRRKRSLASPSTKILPTSSPMSCTTTSPSSRRASEPKSSANCLAHGEAPGPRLKSGRRPRKRSLSVSSSSRVVPKMADSTCTLFRSSLDMVWYQPSRRTLASTLQGTMHQNCRTSAVVILSVILPSSSRVHACPLIASLPSPAMARSRAPKSAAEGENASMPASALFWTLHTNSILLNLCGSLGCDHRLPTSL